MSDHAANNARAHALTDELVALCPTTPSASWGAFLAVRYALICDLRRERKTYAEIAQIVSCDAGQVERIVVANRAMKKGRAT